MILLVLKILNQEKVRIEFYKNIIIKGESMNRNKIFGSLRNMQDIFKVQIFHGVLNN